MDEYDEDDLFWRDAISEYAENLPDSEEKAFKERIAADLQFKQEITQAIRGMGSLIMAAAVITHEDLFKEEEAKLIKLMGTDSEHAYRLRIHFLTNVDN